MDNPRDLRFAVVRARGCTPRERLNAVDTPVQCPTRQALIDRYARVQMNAVLSGKPRDRIASGKAWQLLEAHLAEHGC